MMRARVTTAYAECQADGDGGDTHGSVELVRRGGFKTVVGQSALHRQTIFDEPSILKSCIERIDTARNICRRYMLPIQPTLFGDAVFLRSWGRIGKSGGERANGLRQRSRRPFCAIRTRSDPREDARWAESRRGARSARWPPSCRTPRKLAKARQHLAAGLNVREAAACQNWKSTLYERLAPRRHVNEMGKLPMRIILTGSSGRIGRAIFGTLCGQHE